MVLKQPYQSQRGGGGTWSGPILYGSTRYITA